MTASIATAARQLNALADGTRLAIAMTGSQLTVTAPGMSPIAVTLPAGELVVSDEFRWALDDIITAAADATPDGGVLAPDASFWLTSSMLAAGESAISL